LQTESRIKARIASRFRQIAAFRLNRAIRPVVGDFPAFLFTVARKRVAHHSFEYNPAIKAANHLHKSGWLT
jgi:hypothetical protein